jgi:hypothetical protein
MAGCAMSPATFLRRRKGSAVLFRAGWGYARTPDAAEGLRSRVLFLCIAGRDARLAQTFIPRRPGCRQNIRRARGLCLPRHGQSTLARCRCLPISLDGGIIVPLCLCGVEEREHKHAKEETKGHKVSGSLLLHLPSFIFSVRGRLSCVKVITYTPLARSCRHWQHSG